MNVIVSKIEIDKLEEARKQLWKILEDVPLTTNQFCEIQNVTQVMWRLANTNYTGKVEGC